MSKYVTDEYLFWVSLNLNLDNNEYEFSSHGKKIIRTNTKTILLENNPPVSKKHIMKVTDDGMFDLFYCLSGWCYSNKLEEYKSLLEANMIGMITKEQNKITRLKKILKRVPTIIGNEEEVFKKIKAQNQEFHIGDVAYVWKIQDDQGLRQGIATKDVEEIIIGEIGTKYITSASTPDRFDKHTRLRSNAYKGIKASKGEDQFYVGECKYKLFKNFDDITDMYIAKSLQVQLSNKLQHMKIDECTNLEDLNKIKELLR